MITVRIKDGQLMGVYADPDDGLIGKQFAVVDHDIESADDDMLSQMTDHRGNQRQVTYFTSTIEKCDFTIV
jgi:hypothetical protein